jgi:hypothetical protein
VDPSTYPGTCSSTFQPSIVWVHPLEVEETRTRFAEAQTIAMLAEREAKLIIKELCGDGIRNATPYNLKIKFGGPTVSATAQLRTLKEEKLAVEEAAGCCRDRQLRA